MASYQYVYHMDGVSKTYPGGKKCFENIRLSFLPGVKIGVVGVNGAGKSTLMKIMASLDKEFTGEAWAAEGAKVGYLPQEPSVFRNLTVRQNLQIALDQTGLSSSARRSRRDQLIEEFHLESFLERLGYQLSGGERRRCEVARALAVDQDGPMFLLLDEPFAGVDPLAVADLQQLIQSLREKGMGILITDHNVRETLAITDRAYILNDGAILSSGQSATVANDPLVRRYYLGEDFQL